MGGGTNFIEISKFVSTMVGCIDIKDDPRISNKKGGIREGSMRSRLYDDSKDEERGIEDTAVCVVFVWWDESKCGVKRRNT